MSKHEAAKIEMAVVFHGADYGDLRRVMRGSQWEDFYSDMQPLYEDICDGVTVTFRLDNLTLLSQFLALTAAIRPTMGRHLCINGRGQTVNFDVTISDAEQACQELVGAIWLKAERQ